ncbi:MAG: ABC transporter permease [Salinarimonas sp.]
MFWRAMDTAGWAVLVFIAVPLLIISGASFTAGDIVTFPPEGFSLRWYEQLFQRDEFVRSFVQSVVLAVATAVVALAVGLLTALFMHRYPMRNQELFRAFVMSPLVLPTIVTGVALLQGLSVLGLGLSFLGLLIGHVVITIPYVVRTVGAGLSGLDPALEEAAESLGAGPFRVIWKVVMPAIAPSIMAAVIFVFISSFDEVTVSLFLSDPTVMPLPVRIYAYIDFSLDPMIAALSTLLILLALGFILLLQWIFGLDRAFGLKG